MGTNHYFNKRYHWYSAAMDKGTVHHRSTGRTPSGVGDEKHTKDIVDEPEKETGDAGYVELQHRQFFNQDSVD